jgi:hypothetical protein
MHHQTDTLHESEYFQIFPTCIGMYKLDGYHPAEEKKVKGLIEKDHPETKNFLDDNRLLILKGHINDCIKAYSNEYGVDYYEIKDSWYVKVPNGQSVDPIAYPEETYIGYYFPNAHDQGSSLFLDSPYDTIYQVPKEKSVSVYTARNEKIIIDKHRLVMTPAHLTRYFTKNVKEDMDMIVFNVKPWKNG